jgi:hypothetical protein
MHVCLSIIIRVSLFIYMHAVELDEAQATQMVLQKQRIGASHIQLTKTTAFAKEVSARVETQQVTIENELSELRSILSYTQQAKFLVWMKNNPRAMSVVGRSQNQDIFRQGKAGGKEYISS